MIGAGDTSCKTRQKRPQALHFTDTPEISISFLHVPASINRLRLFSFTKLIHVYSTDVTTSPTTLPLLQEDSNYITSRTIFLPIAHRVGGKLTKSKRDKINGYLVYLQEWAFRRTEFDSKASPKS